MLPKTSLNRQSYESCQPKSQAMPFAEAKKSSSLYQSQTASNMHNFLHQKHQAMRVSQEVESCAKARPQS